VLGLGNKDKKQANKIKKDTMKKRDELLRCAEEMRRLTLTPNSGWHEFIDILNKYVDAQMKHKALTALDRADEKTIYELKLIDHEIYLITQFIKKIPAKIFASEDDLIKKIEQEEKTSKQDVSEDT